MMRRRGFIGGGALVLVACSGGLPHPRYTPHPSTDLVEVGSPPPPARAEAVPKRPADEAVWIDGEWSWRGRKWSWRPGRWVIAPPESTFSPWTSVRRDDGVLFFAPGTWRNATGETIDAPAALAEANATTGIIFDPNGEPLRTGPTIDPNRLQRREAGAP